jgi:elongation factor G
VIGIDLDRRQRMVERYPDDDAPLSALVFKIVTDPYVGRLAYFRVYSGVLQQGTVGYNPAKGKRERIGRWCACMLTGVKTYHGSVCRRYCGCFGFKDRPSPAILCAIRKHPVVLESITFPEPVISVAIEPKTTADQDKMGEALHKLSEEDPTFRVRVDETTGQTIISGMGELHLDVLVDRMLREFRVQANVGRPRVAYRETISRAFPISTTAMSSRPVVAASMVTWCSVWSRLTGAAASSLRTKS